MNLPNKITLSRILLVPVFMLFAIPIPEWISFGTMNGQVKIINEFIMTSGSYIGAAIFVIAASTDGFDGYIARRRHQITRLGQFLDPIADKLLVTAALIALVQRNEVTGWAAMIIIGREFIVTGLRLVAAAEGIVIVASKWGKVKTIVQVVAIAALLLNNYVNIFNFDIASYMMGIAVIITIYSGYDYIVKNIEVINYDQAA